MLALESILHEHYRITYVMDERPDCVIYRAIDLRTSTRVLVAELPQHGDASLADVRVLAGQILNLSVPGLLTLRDHFAQGAIYYLIADDPGGQDLDRVARDRGGPVPESEVLTLIDRLLAALDVLHERNPPLLIGELRPPDLWSSPDGGLSLAPFPLVRHIGSDPSPYRAPELHDTQAEPTTSSDLYAIGAVLYYLLTGWPPPPSAQREAGSPLNAPRNLNTRISALAEQLALRALERKPANRYQRAREMRSALETVRLMAGRPLGATAPIDTPPALNLAVAATAVNGPPQQPSNTAQVYGPLPPAPPYGQPAPGTYVSQPQSAGSYTQLPPSVPQPPPPSIPIPRISNGCLFALIGVLVLMMLIICLIGAFVGYRIFNGASVPLIGGTAMQATSEPSRGGGLVATPTTGQLAPTTGSVAALTTTFTRTQQLEEAGVGPVAYMSDGQLIAVGVGNTIQFRQAETLEQGSTLTGHTGPIGDLAFSPDGMILASSAQDENTIILWDMQTGQPITRLAGHSGWVRSLAFSPDGKILASGSIDGTVRLWDVATRQQRAVLTGHTDYLGAIAFSPDGATLASTSRDGTVRLWDVASGQPRSGFMYAAPINPANNAPYWLTGLSYSPDGKSIAVGSISASIYVIDATSGQLQRELKGHKDWVVIHGLSYSPDGRTLASASIDGTVRLWSTLTGTERASLSDRQLRLRALSWAPDSQHIAATSDTGGSLTVWNTQSRAAERDVLLAQGTVTTMSYSDSGNILGTGGASGMVRLHISPNDRQLNLNGGAPTSQFIGFVSDTQLAAISDAGEVVIIDLTGQDRNRQLEGLSGFAVSIVLNSDHTLLAAGNDSGEVAIWDVASQKLLRTLRGLDGTATLLSFNHDASLIAAVANQDSGSSQIMVWNVQTGAKQTAIANQHTQITALQMPFGSDVVAGASNDGALTIWNAADGSVIRTITASTDERWFSSFSFSPDGKLLVTGSIVGTVAFWDAQSGSQISKVSLGAGSVMAVAFRPDGRQIAVSTFDRGIYLFEPTK
ncbi:MAG: serine/threonine protein kinase [Oscillochloris sp.]|nr:serine/threonine protein kinase [Oscillochloris sp.]